MDEEKALLLAIAANLDEDTPRLIYADWLQEHDNPDRAAFIRFQCYAAQLPIDSPDAVEFNRQAQLLLFQHKQEWEPSATELGECNIGWMRGLPESATLPLGEFLDRSDILMKYYQTINRLNFPGQEIEEDGAIALADCPQLAQIRQLNLADNQIGDDGAGAIACSQFATGLKLLSVTNNRIGAAGAQTVASSHDLQCISTLILKCNDIGNNGALAIANSKTLSHLTHLDLSFCDIVYEGSIIDPDECILTISQSPNFRRLEHLNLNGNNIGPWGATTLAHSVIFSPTMRIVSNGFDGCFSDFQRWERKERLRLGNNGNGPGR